MSTVTVINCQHKSHGLVKTFCVMQALHDQLYQLTVLCSHRNCGTLRYWHGFVRIHSTVSLWIAQWRITPVKTEAISCPLQTVVITENATAFYLHRTWDFTICSVVTTLSSAWDKGHVNFG